MYGPILSNILGHDYSIITHQTVPENRKRRHILGNKYNLHTKTRDGKYNKESSAKFTYECRYENQTRNACRPHHDPAGGIPGMSACFITWDVGWQNQVGCWQEASAPLLRAGWACSRRGCRLHPGIARRQPQRLSWLTMDVTHHPSHDVLVVKLAPFTGGSVAETIQGLDNQCMGSLGANLETDFLIDQQEKWVHFNILRCNTI